MLAVTCDQQQCSAVGLRSVMHIVLRPSKGPYTRHVRPSCCDTVRSAILGTAWLLVIYGLNNFRHRLLSPFFVSLVAYWPLHQCYFSSENKFYFNSYFSFSHVIFSVQILISVHSLTLQPHRLIISLVQNSDLVSQFI